MTSQSQQLHQASSLSSVASANGYHYTIVHKNEVASSSSTYPTAKFTDISPVKTTAKRRKPPTLSLPRSHTFENNATTSNPLHFPTQRRQLHSSSISAITNVQQTTPWGIIRHLCGFPYSENDQQNDGGDGDDDNDDSDEYGDMQLDDVWSVASKRRGVYNLIQVPHRLERLLFFTQAICVYDFLSVFTFLPLRFLFSFLYVISLIISYPFRVVIHKFQQLFISIKRRRQQHRKNKELQKQQQQKQQQRQRQRQQQQQQQQEQQKPLAENLTIPTRRKKNGKSKSKPKSKTSAPLAQNQIPQSNKKPDKKHGTFAGNFRSKSKAQKNREYRRWTRRLISFAIDFQHLSLLFLSVIFLRMLDTSRIYHGIRGQSVIKLYVVFNAIEIFDRLCSSFGVDMLDSLGWTTASAVSYLSSQQYVKRSYQSSSSHALRTFILLSRMIFDYVIALAYVTLHATLLLTWVVTLNVCVNTKNNALLTLLVSNNFVELKGHVFKSFKIPNVFQIVCADGVERFQLTTFLVLMMIESGGSKSLFQTWLIVYVCEIIVDWIKHAFVLKFNRISPRVYRQFGLVISQGIIASFTTNTNVEDNKNLNDHGQKQHHPHILHGKYADIIRSVGGSAVSKRIGFVSLPLAALVIRMVLAPILRLPLPAGGIVWFILLALECVVGIWVVGHAWRRANQGFDDGTNEERERDEYWVQKLMQVERYDLISKS